MNAGAPNTIPSEDDAIHAAERAVRLMRKAGAVPAGAEASTPGSGWDAPYSRCIPLHVPPHWYLAKVHRGDLAPRLAAADAAAAAALAAGAANGQGAVPGEAAEGIAVFGPYPHAPELPFASGGAASLQRIAARTGERLAAFHVMHAAETSERAAVRGAGGRELYYEARLRRQMQRAARHHPDLAATIEAVVRETWSLRQTLVLGACGEDMVLAVGEEVAWCNLALMHEGDPAADVSTLLSRLLVLACLQPEAAEGYLAAGEALWNAYIAAVGADFGDSGALHGKLEPRVCRLTGVMLLAAADGAAPAAADAAHAGRLRRLGRVLTMRLFGRVDGVLTRTLALLKTEVGPERPAGTELPSLQDDTEASAR